MNESQAGPVSDATAFASLHGRRAVVTGASSGIGRAVALEFAMAGADVVVHCAHNVQAARGVCAAIENLGRRSDLLIYDLAQTAACQEIVARAWELWQGVDIWVNNAGADVLTGAAASGDYNSKLQAVLDIDLRGSVLVAKLIGQRMRQSVGGVILNIGWDQADRGMEGDSAEIFAAAKNGVMGFTRSLALSLAPQVRVNCIAPGWIRTGWGSQASEKWQARVLRETPLGRWGDPADVAQLARFLASTEAAFITGQVISVNGGAVR